jgi:hypothetical protein
MPATVYYCCTKWHDYTIRPCIGQAQSADIELQICHYRDLDRERPRGHYVFADLERLHYEAARRAQETWSAIRGRDGTQTCLNHPVESRRRYELLRILSERGRNRFDVYRLTEHRCPARWPVFLRLENEHLGSLTSLLYTTAELESAIAESEARGLPRDNVLIVEFLDTRGADGLFRKYSAMRVGDQIFPVHVQFSKDWVVKFSQIVNGSTVCEEMDFMERLPHEEYLREVFQLARIEYGRVDFSIVDGMPQIWEINTNPHLLAATGSHPLREPVRARFADFLTGALARFSAR